jgi:hypothetical protein
MLYPKLDGERNPVANGVALPSGATESIQPRHFTKLSP